MQINSDWKFKTESELRVAMQNFYNNLLGDEGAVKNCFSPDYVQVADGKTLNFEEFLKHLQILKRDTKEMHFEVLDAAYTQSTLADRHIVRIKKNDDQPMKVEVLAFYKIYNGKIIGVNEVSRLIQGEISDRDIGSRTE
ncbi:nuclear transport factor 2 family protein [Providencia burhodogranariea]|uniref:SnoaL-like domain-containing protein n=1 Tax=Providencia burhodogranariea DSM 19968 TaxID=1141662 RepID=K8W9R3_9GAMM|nr:nuclear transport factor 2 family protein [Providencia burhodogranariea]EKT52935.1 hypothetical protein OOA_19454 [Providencia burhodogranariea DSM 19968]